MNVNNILQNYDLNKDKDYTILENKINDLLEQLEYTDNENEQKKILSKIDQIKELLKDTKKKINSKYPSYNDKDL